MECLHTALRNDSWSFIIPLLIADWHIISVEKIFLYHKFYTIKHLILIPPKIVIFAALRERYLCCPQGKLPPYSKNRNYFSPYFKTIIFRSSLILRGAETMNVGYWLASHNITTQPHLLSWYIIKFNDHISSYSLLIPLIIFPLREIKVLHWCPGRPVLPHGEKMLLQPWLVTLLMMVSQ